MSLHETNVASEGPRPIVESYNDWDPLEEIIVGSAKGCFIPEMDVSFRTFHWPDEEEMCAHASGFMPDWIVDEIEEDIDGFVDVLEEFGATVRRPDPINYSVPIATPDWCSSGHVALMPRDSILVVGQQVIEVPMICRFRQYEVLAYREILIDYFKKGASWTSAPRPRLLDDAYDLSCPDDPRLNETEPLFDAANVLRCGEDLFYNVNNSANNLGLDWLQRHLSPGYRIHPVTVSRDHIDTTLVPLRPGVVLVNTARVNQRDLPEQFKKWKIIEGPETAPNQSYGLGFPYSSNWIGLNVLSLDENTVVVEKTQVDLIRILEAHGFDVVPLTYRHGRTLGGSWHCITSDVRRRGQLENYFA